MQTSVLVIELLTAAKTDNRKLKGANAYLSVDAKFDANDVEAGIAGFNSRNLACTAG